MRALLACVLLSSAAFADTITTKDGARHEGRILDTTDAGYVFRFDNGVAGLIRFDQVEGVQRDAVAAPAADAPVMRVAPTLVPRSDRGAAIPVEIANLRQELSETRMFMPIAGTVGGAIVMLVAAVMLMDPTYNSTQKVACGVGVGAGAALLITGIVTTVRRSHEHSELEERIAALTSEARGLGLVVPGDRD